MYFLLLIIKVNFRTDDFQRLFTIFILLQIFIFVRVLLFRLLRRRRYPILFFIWCQTAFPKLHAKNIFCYLSYLIWRRETSEKVLCFIFFYIYILFILNICYNNLQASKLKNIFVFTFIFKNTNKKSLPSS